MRERADWEVMKWSVDESLYDECFEIVFEEKKRVRRG